MVFGILPIPSGNKENKRMVTILYSKNGEGASLTLSEAAPARSQHGDTHHDRSVSQDGSGRSKNQ
jgi:hypothetical protein